jgi:cell division protein FtsB
MILQKKYSLRIFLAAEIIIFTGFYFFGNNGMLALWKLQQELNVQLHDVQTAKDEVTQLQANLALQKKHPFFLQKIAREQLQMARADEEIYMYTF